MRQILGCHRDGCEGGLHRLYGIRRNTNIYILKELDKQLPSRRNANIKQLPFLSAHLHWLASVCWLPVARKFCNWQHIFFIRRFSCLENIVFTNLAWFHFNGHINGQISRTWSAETHVHGMKILCIRQNRFLVPIVSKRNCGNIVLWGY
jgi:hypothetical protein